MIIEKQYCKLHQAKTLKALGISQDTLMSFDIDELEDRVYLNTTVANKRYSIHHQQNTYAAYSVAELAEMLPWKYFNDSALEQELFPLNYEPYYGFWKAMDKWSFRFADYQDKSVTFYDTQAECYATYLIHLLETKQITSEEVNLRLNPNYGTNF